MTNRKPALILPMLSSVALFILTFTQFDKFFEFMLPEIENLHYQTSEPGSQLKRALFFSITIGLTPVLLYWTWKLAPIDSTKRRLFSGLIVLVFMTVSISLRQHLLKSELEGLPNLVTQTGEAIYNSIAVEDLHFEYYLLGGLISGCVVSFFCLKDKIRIRL